MSGSREAVDRAKRLIDEIVQRGATDSSMLPPGQELFEMRLPGNKCGVIIGKSGETIKRLGEQYGVKLVVVQDSNSAPGDDKPLRITGESERVQRCKEAVLQLIAPKGPDQGGRTNEYGSRSGGYQPQNGELSSYIRVASDKAGIVIGKGGETIKEINRRSNAVCEIDKAYRNTDGPDKFFTVRGSYDQIMYCQQLIYEKLTGKIGHTPPSGFFGQHALEPTPGYVAGSPTDTSSSQAYGAWGEYPTGAANGSAGMDPMAAWAAYYQSYYQQAGAAAASTPAANPQAGQQDYSLAWVEYYRSMGMHAEADAILKQTQANGTNGGSSASTSTSTTSASTATTTTTTSQAGSTSPNSLQAQAAAWQSYAAAYAGYPGYSGAYPGQSGSNTTQNQ